MRAALLLERAHLLKLQFADRLTRSSESGLVRAAFASWRAHVQDMRRRRREVATRFALSDRGALLDAFRRWRQLVALSRTRAAVVRQMARRRQRSCLALCMHAWSDHVRSSLGARRVMRRVLHRLARLQLWSAWRHWRRDTQQSHSLAEASRSAQLHQRQLMSRILARFVHRDLSRAFAHWRTLARDDALSCRAARTHEQLLAFSTRRLHRALLCTVLRAWRQCAVQGRLRAAAMRQWMRTVRARLLSRAFRRLHATTLDRRSLSLSSERLSVTHALHASELQSLRLSAGRLVMRKCVQRVLNASLFSAFSHWRRATASASMRALAQRLSQERAIELQSLRVSMMRAIMGRVLQRLLHGRVFAAFQQWRRVTASSVVLALQSVARDRAAGMARLRLAALRQWVARQSLRSLAKSFHRLQRHAFQVLLCFMYPEV